MELDLELLWVTDASEARSELVKPTRLLDRWTLRGAGACPFGIVLRPTITDVYIAPPFRSWRYTPPYEPASDYAMTLGFSGAADVTADLRPELPLVLRW